MILRAATALVLTASPLWAEEEDAPVFGAQPSFHHGAPLADDGRGDYGFSGEEAPEEAESAPSFNPYDPALLAYDEEEAAVEADYAADDAEADVVID